MQRLQRPIGSGFGVVSTASEVIRGIDLAGKTAIVTGGYSGLGLETVRVLKAAGAAVLVPARDRERAAKALAGLPGVEIASLDLLDPRSIDAFASDFIEGRSALHILVNSAGIMACPLTRDARGYEAQFATNHLGHFQLVERLMPALHRAEGARVVSVSSRGHRYSPVIFEDPNFEHRDYDRWKAYGQSKTANVLFALSLDERGMQEGIRAFALHPGAIVDTGLAKHLTRDDLRGAGAIDAQGRPVLDAERGFKTVEQGAATIVWCATSRQLDGLGGLYCENCDVASLAAPPRDGIAAGVPGAYFGVLPYAVDPDGAERLWRLSERLLAEA
jgi:NAD(P)-dependent dehydrogenase (short-subunit alcohol dehydrogenase family)